MTELERKCQRVGVEDWETLGDIVSRHLKISISTPRDAQRILKKRLGAEVIRKLVRCSQNHRSEQVYCGILACIRNITADSMLAQEIYKQNLQDFVFRCLDRPRDSKIRRMSILALLDLVSRLPELRPSLELTIKAFPVLVNAISDHLIPETQNDSDMLCAILSTLQGSFSRLSTYETITHRIISADVIETFRIPSLAKMLVDLLDDSKFSLPLAWTSLQLISVSLSWTPYYDSRAIRSIPNIKGVTLFVALTFTSSVSLRCIGFLGLLNHRSREYSRDCQEVRFCTPQLVLSIHPIAGPAASNEEKLEYYDLMAKIFNDTLQKTRHAIPPPDWYGDAMRVVEFALHGPRCNDESYNFPSERIFRSSRFCEPEEVIHMIRALKDHGKNPEAGILNLSLNFYGIGAMVHDEDDPAETRAAYLVSRFEVDKGLARWPNHCFFYYAMIKGQSGSNYLDWAAQGLQCSDCTPYLEGQIHYEKSLNLFSMGVRQVSSFLDEPRWWSKGVSALKQAEESISRALVCLEPGCAQERMMIVLRFMTNLLTASAPNLDDIYCEESKEALATLRAKKFAEHSELRAAVGDLIRFRSKASQDWSSLISKTEKLEHVLAEAQKVRNFKEDDVWDPSGLQPSSSGLDRTGRIYNADLPRCAWCERASMGLKLCTRCGKAKYCDKTCQQFHWKEAHKKECRSPEDLGVEGSSSRLEVSASLILVWNLPLAIVDV